ncbi:uncharacterized protein EI97DRAFT_443573 [Westerdykella ornata]|uniref:Uncharacterized protein n=1 Tax=Westerdykella ornata TaxID=318751 RepID=A0A6A6JJF4_WESOR|nr:uncharacterized protein EI97DRAFT_443573 [Westerdykella ornata]KAF2274999.1 hypothetical protein EI97DRAFT_443573 [Westerdykella ornata]
MPSVKGARMFSSSPSTYVHAALRVTKPLSSSWSVLVVSVFVVVGLSRQSPGGVGGEMKGPSVRSPSSRSQAWKFPTPGVGDCHDTACAAQRTGKWYQMLHSRVPEPERTWCRKGPRLSAEAGAKDANSTAEGLAIQPRDWSTERVPLSLISACKAVERLFLPSVLTFDVEKVVALQK